MTDDQTPAVPHGISRRKFLQFCGLMAATLALPPEYVGRIASALTTAVRPPVIWLEFQDCTGDSESFLREPTLIDVVDGDGRIYRAGSTSL